MNIFLYNTVLFFNYIIIFYVLLFSFCQFYQIISTLIIIYSSRKKEQNLRVDSFKDYSEQVPISIIIPAYNEGTIIIDSVNSMLHLDYPMYEVVLVNDGSTDDMLEKLIQAFDLKSVPFTLERKVPCADIQAIYQSKKYPHLKVIDKLNGGKKADACNAGINISKYPYFINVDADSLLDKDSLYWVSRSFKRNKNCIAVGGMMRINNDNAIINYRVAKFQMPSNWLARFQILEYIRSFLVGRAATAELGCLMVISGAFGGFHKKTAIKVGGYSLNTVGEDMDLVLKLHSYMRAKKTPYKIVFSPRAVCWTQAPEKYSELRGQRERWQVGLIQSLANHRKMLFNPRYGTVGLIGLPYQFLFEFLGPVMEIIGLIVMFFLCLMDTFYYHFVTVWFRLSGMIHYKKLSHSWKPITRQPIQNK